MSSEAVYIRAAGPEILVHWLPGRGSPVVSRRLFPPSFCQGCLVRNPSPGGEAPRVFGVSPRESFARKVVKRANFYRRLQSDFSAGRARFFGWQHCRLDHSSWTGR
jgi:hypothetical protein